jgi:glycosyltransferase involved in cell wall biosynthesis
LNNNQLKLLYVGRFFQWKNPVNIIMAAAETEGVRLVCIGDGPIWPRIKSLVETLRLREIRLRRSMRNQDVLNEFRKADGVILNTYYHEWSKVMIEAMLLGRPVIVNEEVASSVPEISSPSLCEFCPDTVSGYKNAIRKFKSKIYRKVLASKAKKMAWTLANPKKQSIKQVKAILGLSNATKKKIKELPNNKRSNPPDFLQSARFFS